MSKEYNTVESELPHGYKVRDDGQLESWEHALVKTKEGFKTNTKTMIAPHPEKITEEQLNVLIDNYIYGYIDRHKTAPIHTRQLVSALLELKTYRGR
jgi:hypothetical protein